MNQLLLAFEHRTYVHRTLDGDYQCLIVWSVVKAV
jgi:hypothetical protein